MVLILDLDDTIFETRSMDMSIFNPARQVVEKFTSGRYGETKSERIIDEIKSKPFDIVAEKYHFPNSIKELFYHTIQTISYNLRIHPYADYTALRDLPYPKYLVTTGMSNLQQAKINALKIKSDFTGIFIDDPFDTKRICKKDYFRHILSLTHPKQAPVIGDNPDSELKAGRELGLTTIQRLNSNYEKSPYADYVIQTFNELDHIIKNSNRYKT